MMSAQYNGPTGAAQPARLLADWLRAYVGLVPRWRVDYFERRSRQLQRSDVIAAQNAADALEKVRSRMAPTCCHAEVTPLPATSVPATLSA
jgi:hypothetical protein